MSSPVNLPSDNESLSTPPAPLPDVPRPQPRRSSWDRIGNAVGWPLAILLMGHRFFIRAVNGSVTDDFTTVYSALRRFIEGTPVYNEIYHHVDPHYLYNPGATLLLAPLGYIGDFTMARLAFIAVNLLAIVLALGLLTRMVGFALRSMVWPLSIALAMLTETVQNTLIFSNINGILLLMMVLFLWCVIHKKSWIGGLIIGLAILVKPMFLPLLFLPLVKKQWGALIVGVLIPVIFNVIAWPLVPGASDYITRTVPYLGETRDFANSSLPGLAIYFGMPGWMELTWFLVFGVMVGVSVLALLRFRNTEPFFWAATTSGVLLTGVFFLSSLGQMYYSMMIFPMIFTLLGSRSVFHNWLAWVAAFFFLTPSTFASPHWPDIARWMEFFRATAGWGLLIAVTFVSTVIWFVMDIRSKRVVVVPETTAPPSSGYFTGGATAASTLSDHNERTT
ncbi:Alpha-(1-_3)-arabinofuranosyltransferase [Corynebacterium faecale]|uniref:glycosyltransferase family 87 protein n=1 Tax=Corynebacterium faecale TaxID=1758466 RepID=UPI003F497A20|nr:Alpha-(1->3)-arabinofuranosyltransferase [Corynebacterium faecale]